MSSYAPKITDIGSVTGTDREVYVTWSFSKHSTTKEYKVTWSYLTYVNNATGSKWFTGNTDTVTSQRTTYSAPANATKVKATVLPIAKTHKVKNRDTPYFTGKKATSKEFTITTYLSKTNNAVLGPADIKFQQIDGSARTVAASWSGWKTDGLGIIGYDVRWQYKVGTIWFEGSSTTVTNRSSSYDAPEAATKVAIKITPKSNRYVFPESEPWAEYDTANLRPTPPAVPTVTIKNNKLTASVNYYAANVTTIEFYVIADNTRLVANTAALLVNDYASIQITVAAGSAYKVKALAANGANKSEYSEYSAEVYSKPKAPGNFTSYVAFSETEVLLTWPEDPNVDSYTVEYATKKEYFDAGNTQTSPDHTEGRAIISVDTGNTWFFRCCAIRENISSDWNEIVSVSIGKKPAEPTTWSLTTTAAVGDILKLYWVHNAQDNSSQTAAKLELTINGDTREIDIPNTREGDEKDKTSEYDYDTSDLEEGAVITWRVKTKGVIDAYSEWSILRTIKVYAAPTLSFLFSEERKWFWDPFNFNTDAIYTATSIPVEYPEILDHLPLDICARALPDTQTALRYTVIVTALNSYETTANDGTTEIINAGSEVYNKVVYPQEATTLKNHLLKTLSASDISLENNISYRLTCTVAMDSGLSASCFIEFTVGWADDYLYPNAEIMLDNESYQAYITPYCEDENEERMGDVLLSVYRRNFDGTFTALGTDLLGRNNITVVDPHPALDYARYRIIAKSVATGQIWYDDLSSIDFGEKAIIIQWDEDWQSFSLLDNELVPEEPPWSGSLLRLPYNIDVSEQNAPDVELVEYIGRSHPVSYFGTQKGETTTWNTLIDAEDVETLYSLRRLKAYMGNCYVREPSGIGFWATIGVSMTQTHREVTIPVTLNITRVEGGA